MAGQVSELVLRQAAQARSRHDEEAAERAVAEAEVARRAMVDQARARAADVARQEVEAKAAVRWRRAVEEECPSSQPQQWYGRPTGLQSP